MTWKFDAAGTVVELPEELWTSTRTELVPLFTFDRFAKPLQRPAFGGGAQGVLPKLSGSLSPRSKPPGDNDSAGRPNRRSEQEKPTTAWA